MTGHNAILRSKAQTSLGACTARIMRTFNQATREQVQQGHAWYADARSIVVDMAERGGISVDRAAVVTAHLSPRTTWQRNIAGAYQLIMTGEADHCMSANVSRALVAMDATDPWSTFGPDAHKIRRFAANLTGREDVVTVDIWAARVAFGQGWGKDWRTNIATDIRLVLMLGRRGVYAGIERAYLNAAQHLSLPATTVQATVWGVARNGRFG